MLYALEKICGYILSRESNTFPYQKEKEVQFAMCTLYQEVLEFCFRMPSSSKQLFLVGQHISLCDIIISTPTSLAMGERTNHVQ